MSPYSTCGKDQLAYQMKYKPYSMISEKTSFTTPPMAQMSVIGTTPQRIIDGGFTSGCSLMNRSPIECDCVSASLDYGEKTVGSRCKALYPNGTVVIMGCAVGLLLRRRAFLEGEY